MSGTRAASVGGLFSGSRALACRLCALESDAVQRCSVPEDAYLFIVASRVDRDTTLLVDETRIELAHGRPASVVPVNFGQTVRSARPGRSGSYHYIACDRDYVSLLCDELYGLGAVRFTPGQRPASENLLGDLLRFRAELASPRGSGPMLYPRSLGNLVILDLLGSAITPRDVAAGHRLRSDGVRRVCALMRERCGDEHLVAELASVAGMSASHFFARFRHETGRTPHQFLNRIRISEAMRLLEGATPVAEVCRTVGFTSLSGFEEAFKRHVGMSPLEYRASRLRG